MITIGKVTEKFREFQACGIKIKTFFTAYYFKYLIHNFIGSCVIGKFYVSL